MPEKPPHPDSLSPAASEIESAAERAAFLDRACGNDSVLRKQVEQLLQSDQQAGRFLVNPPAEELRRRQRLTYAAGTAIAAILVIGISVSLWQMARANSDEQLARNEAARAAIAEQLAQDAAARATAAEKQTAETLVEVAAARDAKELARKDAEDIATFLGNVFQSPDPTRDGREIKVVELLDTATKKLETDLADQPARRAMLQNTLAQTYNALGLYRAAIPLQEQARDYLLETSGLDDPDTLKAIHALALYYDAAGRQDEALQLREEVLTLSRRLLGLEHPDTIRAMADLAISWHNAGRLDEALQLREEVLTLSRKLLGLEHPDTIRAMQNLAISWHDAGRRDEVLALEEQVLALRRKLLGPEHPDTIRAMQNLANSYHNAGRLDEALQMREEVLTLRRKLFGPEHPDTLESKTEAAPGSDDQSVNRSAPGASQPAANGSPAQPDGSLKLKGIPDWLKTHEFPQKTFTFVRIQWSDEAARRPNTWMTDYPAADINLAETVGSLTSLDVSTPSLVLKLTDPRLSNYPFAYIAEPGSLSLSDAETAALRKYLTGGGFLMADDFWGDDEWDNLRAVMKQVFPDRDVQDLQLSHPMFHCVFDLKEKPQVTAIAHFMSGRTTERSDAKEAFYRAIVDDDGRIMVLMCHNTDLADGWERYSDDEKYRQEMSEPLAFPMGINAVFYALRK